MPQPPIGHDPPDASAPPQEIPDLPVARRRRQAEEWALVLRAEGMAPEVRRTERGFELDLPDALRSEALRVLVEWRNENLPRASAEEALLPRSEAPSDLIVAYAAAVALLAFHRVSETQGWGEMLRDAGSAQAVHILAGEWWRIVTALTLHGGLTHVLSNTLIGGLFLGALAHRIGPGLALCTFIVSGALGNLANALYHRTSHDSIGASTAVFGVVGVLSGLEVWRRQRSQNEWRRAWVPLGAGIGLLAMLGVGGERTDYGAHIFGLAAGALTGYLIAPAALRKRLGPAAQSTSAVLALATIALCWKIALS